ncbi:AraC family transcriptional regulator [Dyadobacter sp. 676]|uniref:AraC family transcriptional regulator n=1 Tax=Dyadobacter sp. 676 TaxID=3088362 RepID=A0AAU8FI73_9BACT
MKSTTNERIGIEALSKSGLAFVAETTANQNASNRYGYTLAITMMRPFNCILAANEQIKTFGFIVNRNVNHIFLDPGTVVFVAYFEPKSYWGQIVAPLLGAKPFFILDEILSQAQSDIELLAGPFETNYCVLSDYVYNILALMPKQQMNIQAWLTGNKRILPALRLIEESVDKPLELSHIAALLNLSTERARHLFVTEVGLPFSQYILWCRLRKTVNALTSEKMRFSEAVGMFGFADQAHFTRTFKSIFGVPPKTFLDKSKVIL